jgi:hypothetical protein
MDQRPQRYRWECLVIDPQATLLLSAADTASAAAERPLISDFQTVNVETSYRLEVAVFADCKHQSHETGVNLKDSFS